MLHAAGKYAKLSRQVAALEDTAAREHGIEDRAGRDVWGSARIL